jgi:hypothetical protein
MMRPSRTVSAVILAIALQAPSLEAEAQTDAEAAERARSNQLFQHAEQALEHAAFHLIDS